jgi:hypothetical protein
MKPAELSRILADNPQVDKNKFERSVEMLRAVRATGVRPSSIAASPPVDPYSTNRTARSGESCIHSKPAPKRGRSSLAYHGSLAR